jgi:hypothetical protein
MTFLLSMSESALGVAVENLLHFALVPEFLPRVQATPAEYGGVY